jgi:hypothetical protein
MSPIVFLSFFFFFLSVPGVAGLDSISGMITITFARFGFQNE